MSDLAATNCGGCGDDRGGCGCNNNGCGCDNGCNNGWGLSCGNNSCCNILWITFCCVCAEIMVVDATTDAATATAAGSLSYCFCCAAMAADVDADNRRLLAEGPLPLPFRSKFIFLNFALQKFSHFVFVCFPASFCL